MKHRVIFGKALPNAKDEAVHMADVGGETPCGLKLCLDGKAYREDVYYAYQWRHVTCVGCLEVRKRARDKATASNIRLPGF